MNKNLLILGAGGHGCIVSVGSIVKASCIIKACTTIESGRVVSREDKTTPQEFLEANGFSFEVGV